MTQSTDEKKGFFNIQITKVSSEQKLVRKISDIIKKNVAPVVGLIKKSSRVNALQYVSQEILPPLSVLNKTPVTKITWSKFQVNKETNKAIEKNKSKNDQGSRKTDGSNITFGSSNKSQRTGEREFVQRSVSFRDPNLANENKMVKSQNSKGKRKMQSLLLNSKCNYYSYSVCFLGFQQNRKGTLMMTFMLFGTKLYPFLLALNLFIFILTPP